MNKRTFIKVGLFVLIAIAVFFIINYNFTFGFAALFVFLLLFMPIPLIFKEHKTRVVKDTRLKKDRVEYVFNKKGRPVTNKTNSLVASLCIFVFGLLTLYCLGNYFNPKEKVFGNYQHHALRIDGVEVEYTKLPFNLAGANKKSFIDDAEISGQIQITDFDSTRVTLTTKGVMAPVYRKWDAFKHKNLNTNLIPFKKGDIVELIGTEKDQNGNPLLCKFMLEEVHETKLFSHKHFIYNIDSTRCVFFDVESPQDTASFSTFLKSGYPLSQMAADIPLSIDLRGVKVVRDSVDIKIKHKHFKKFSEQGYMLELAPMNKLKAVKINGGEPYYLSDLSNKEDQIFVPLKQSIYIGNGKYTYNSIKFELSEDKTKLYVKYSQPRYQYLQKNTDDAAVSLLVTNTIMKDNHPDEGSSGLLDNLTDHVLLFDLFKHYDNEFNIQPFYLNYRVGPTNEKMIFSLALSEHSAVIRDIKVNTQLPDIKATNGTKWITRIENFKDTTPFNAKKLSWILLVIIMLSVVSMAFSYSGRLFTGVEYACHLLIIGLLALRFFLLWRITVFPPVSSISLHEYMHFRANKWLLTPLLCAAAFYIVLSIVKFLLVNNKLSVSKKKAALDIKSIRNICLVIFGAETLLFIIAHTIKIPVLCVLAPVFLYICFDLYIYYKYASSYVKDMEAADRKDSGNLKTKAIVLAVSVFNMLLTSVYTLVLDGGYGVMFSMFAFFSFWLKLSDIFQYTRYKKAHKNLINIAFFALFIILVGIVIAFKQIFISLCGCITEIDGHTGNVWLFFFCAWIIFCIITILTLIVLDFNFKDRQSIKWLSGFAAAILAVCMLGAVLAPEIAGSHMEYRTRVHMQDAGEILQSVDSPQAQNKFLQASLNDWILHEYQVIGKDVVSFGENGKGYFKLQPQSKLGAMWFAQTTDICLSRFIIAEHGTTLAWLLVFAFVGALILTLRTPAAFRWSRIVSVEVFLLFALQALMIMLANTRAFIFFGQDFPLISLTSRLSSMYFFALAILAVFAALIGKRDYNKELYNDIKNDKILKDNCKSITWNIIIFFLVTAIFLYGSRSNLNLSKPNKDKSEAEGKTKETEKKEEASYYGDRTYDADTVLREMNYEIDKYINPLLIAYQDTVPATLRRNMSAYIHAFKELNKEIDTMTVLSSYTKVMFNNYVKIWSKHNSTNDIIFLRNHSTYDDKGVKHNKLEFAVRNECYQYELPGKVSQRWTGSVLQYNSENLPETAIVKEGSGHIWLYLPKDYSPHNRPIQVVKINKGKEAQFVSSNAVLKLSDKIDVVEVGAYDYVSQNGRSLTDAPLSNRKYLAKRININDGSKFVYPYGHKMFWVKDKAYSIKLKKEKDKKFDDSDAFLTVDVDLCNSIYDAIEANDKGKKLRFGVKGDDRSVVIADGDGNIRALVNHRLDKKYRLNPNDFNAIAEISDSLYIWGERGRSTETRYFGDFTSDLLRNGPGSSQKPILWTAVTSMYNTGWWNSLETLVIPDNQILKAEIEKGSNNYKFTSFAGRRIQKKDGFVSLIDDESNPANNGYVDLSFYMYKSSNYYNAIIAYLGAFPKSAFEDDEFMKISNEFDNNTLFRQRPRIQLPQKNEKDGQKRYTGDYIKLFPAVYISNKNKALAFNKFFDVNAYKESTALAPMGLSTNFSLASNKTNDNSRFNIRVLRKEEKPSLGYLNESLVRSVAIGNNTLWLVSPRKMAEMYGRTISMNKAYTLHLDSAEKANPYEFFDLDESWSNATADSSKYKEYMKARKQLICGMSHVFDIGTAKEIWSVLAKRLKLENINVLIDNNDGRPGVAGAYYIYGKTGTIDGKWVTKGTKVKEQDHLLATVITNKKVSMCSLKDLKDMKFYVIYQSDYNYDGWRAVDGEVLYEVITSDVFKKYMGIK